MWELQEEPTRDSPMRLTETLCEESCLLGIKNSIKEWRQVPQDTASLLFCLSRLSFCFVTVLAARTFLNKLFFNVTSFGG